MLIIPQPPVPEGTPEEQLRQLRAWLSKTATRLQTELNMELEALAEAQNT